MRWLHSFLVLMLVGYAVSHSVAHGAAPTPPDLRATDVSCQLTDPTTIPLVPRGQASRSLSTDCAANAHMVGLEADAVICHDAPGNLGVTLANDRHSGSLTPISAGTCDNGLTRTRFTLSRTESVLIFPNDFARDTWTLTITNGGDQGGSLTFWSLRVYWRLYRLSGQVTDQKTGNGIAGAQIWLQGPLSLGILSDATGAYTTGDSLLEGTYQVTASAPRYITQTTVVMFTIFSSDQTVNFALPPLRLLHLPIIARP